MENTVAKKLEGLIKLQNIDIELDDLVKIRGALPDEVMDLEDELAGYQTRIEKQNLELGEIEANITANREAIKDAEKLIKRYEEQQMNVRNNREYDAITKEIELQQLEIQILEKRIREAYAKIEAKKGEIAETVGIADERKKDLQTKKEELEVITKESEEDERKLSKSRDSALKNVEDRLLISYEKLRKNMRNGLAVVSVLRDACGGCFNIVPPQKQAEIRDQKKIIICEHCGRVLANVVEEMPVEEVKPKRRTTKRTA